MVNGVLFIDEDNRSRRVPFPQVETARREHHFEGVITERLLKGLEIGAPGSVAHHIDVCCACTETTKTRGKHVVAEPHDGVKLEERILPPVNQMLCELSSVNPDNAVEF